MQPEQFFDMLQVRNNSLEMVEEEKELIDGLDQAWDGRSKGGVEYINKLPIELKILLLQFAGPIGFFKMNLVSSGWNCFLTSKQESHLKRQAIKYMLKNFCLQLWPQPRFKTSRNFLNRFNNWREMLKMRPLIRYDGVYRCKIIYLRDGLSENSVYHPVHQVTSYKYIRFLRSG